VNGQQELTSAIRDAEKLHGHLGPFLVIGVRMGKIAKRVLNAREEDKLRACARIPVLTPFSCILDGIQVTTGCTVGNQRLSIEDSKEIAVRFELERDKAIRICVRREAVEELMGKISEGAPNEELAWEIARMPEDRLFSVDKQ
jgi:formylmethanofuran dehydrogenase subunit E